MRMKLERFCGTWQHEDSSVEYTVTLSGEVLRVSGVDTTDGEELRVSDVLYDRSELRFTTLCPSTDYALRHVFRNPESGCCEHEFTRVEIWKCKI